MVACVVFLALAAQERRRLTEGLKKAAADVEGSDTLGFYRGLFTNESGSAAFMKNPGYVSEEPDTWQPQSEQFARHAANALLLSLVVEWRRTAG